MTLFVAEATGADPAALEKARFIKDGFSWPAFAFGWLWLLFHRLWVALAVWVVIEAGVLWLVAPHVPPPATVLVDLLGHLFLGFEGNRLRLRSRADISDVVEARDRDEAEAIFFRRLLGEAGR